MQMYDSFQQFWNDYAQYNVNSHGFSDWVLGKYVHISDMDYDRQRQQGSDELGFQPLWLTLVNPFTKAKRELLIKHVNDEVMAGFMHHVRSLYVQQLMSRFGSFQPDQFHAFAEYDSWDAFYSVWLERNGQSVIQHHIPLLFDHMPQLEYWARKQTGQEVLPYQRLLVTTYFAPKNEFYEFFIKDVDDAEIERIKMLSQSRIGLNFDKLYARTGV